MIVDIFKKSILAKRAYKIFTVLILIVVLILYFKLFFTLGIEFDDTFLKREIISSETHYIGNSPYGKLHITVKGLKNKQSRVDVIYDLPNSIFKQYTVELKESDNWESENVIINDSNGDLLFKGVYRKDSLFLYDKTGMPLMDDQIQILINGESPYNSDYDISLKNVADLACFSTETIRGRFEYLIFAVLLFALTIVDIKFPLLFFSLRHYMDVKEPEPTEFYLIMQKISRFVYPIIGIILMIIAVSH